LCSLVYSTYPPSFVVLAFGNALEDCNVDARIKSGNDTLAYDVNLVNFRPVTRSLGGSTVYRRRRSALGLVKLRLLEDGRHC